MRNLCEICKNFLKNNLFFSYPGEKNKKLCYNIHPKRKKAGEVMVSVVIVAGKNDRYLERQIRSVLPQLAFGDEVIVYDERPGGVNQRTAVRLAAEDSRVLWIEGRDKGAVANFVSAVRYCRGDRIFFCDRGDVWLPDKLKRVNQAFDNGADLVVHNAYVTDTDLNITDYSLFSRFHVRKGVLHNLHRNGYFIGCMAVRRKMFGKIMPIPKNIPGCDLWIGLLCEIYGKVSYVDMPLAYCPLGGRAAVKEEKDRMLSRKAKRTLITKLYKRVMFKS